MDVQLSEEKPDILIEFFHLYPLEINHTPQHVLNTDRCKKNQPIVFDCIFGSDPVMCFRNLNNYSGHQCLLNTQF